MNRLLPLTLGTVSLRKAWHRLALRMLLIVVFGSGFPPIQGEPFLYQGRLTRDGIAATGSFDFRFSLQLASTNPVGAPLIRSNVPIQGGSFQVELDFGPGAFDGTARFLETLFRSSGPTNPWIPLSPRQPIAFVPMAVHAQSASMASRVANASIQSEMLSSNSIRTIHLSPSSVTGAKLASNSIATLHLTNGSVTTPKLAGGAVTSDRMAHGSVGSLQLADILDLGDSNTSGRLTLYRATTRTNSIILDGFNSRIDLWSPGGGQRLLLSATTNGGSMALRNDGGTPTMTLTGGASGRGGELNLHTSDGSLGLRLQPGTRSPAGEITLYGTNGRPTVRLTGNTNNEGRVITQVLQITGGSDLSERFSVRSTSFPAAPGHLVVIDPAHPGNLRLSHVAHDRTVAGIISGAGGVQSGLVMSQEGSIADGTHPVALSGRVYAWMDATDRPIEPGDLLTTSDIPGHGMKADPAKSSGAILGKAMTRLSSGRGLVLVLVSLQ